MLVFMHILTVERREDASVCAHMLVLDVDKERSGSKQKFCPHSIFSMSAGEGRGYLKCEDDRSLLSQRLWSDILMCLCLNHTPTHTQPQTSDIPTNPETFWYLTSSYHALWLHFDLLLSHIIFCVITWRPPHIVQLWKCFLRAWFWQISSEGPKLAGYLKCFSV